MDVEEKHDVENGRSRVKALTLPCQDLWSCARAAWGPLGAKAAFQNQSWWDVLLCVCVDGGQTGLPLEPLWGLCFHCFKALVKIAKKKAFLK